MSTHYKFTLEAKVLIVDDQDGSEKLWDSDAQVADHKDYEAIVVLQAAYAAGKAEMLRRLANAGFAALSTDPVDGVSQARADALYRALVPV